MFDAYTSIVAVCIGVCIGKSVYYVGWFQRKWPDYDALWHLVCCTMGGLIESSHKLVMGHYPPASASLHLWQILYLSSSKAMQHPRTQNFFVEMRDAWASPGTMCTLVTWCGSQGISMLHVCVDCIMSPFGNVILIGLTASSLLTIGVPLTRKWHVAPKSDIS